MITIILLLVLQLPVVSIARDLGKTCRVKL